MTAQVNIAFGKLVPPTEGALVLLTNEENSFGTAADACVAGEKEFLERAMNAVSFKGKAKAMLDVIAPGTLSVERILLVGIGDGKALDASAMLKLGGMVMGKLKELKAKTATIFLDLPEGEAVDPMLAAEFAQGLRLRSYEFQKYKTKKKEDQVPFKKAVIALADPGRAKKIWGDYAEVASGVELARDLVNEAPNVLGPVEFAKIAKDLDEEGLKVEVLTDKDMKKLGMGALLGVAQGSSRPARLAIMRWEGGPSDKPPIAFIGKGVVFDTGGISIKPAQNMEDMKGDMAGAAAVTGLMRALAGRKARVNAIGLIGLVENMPDGNSYRPGDILTSLSGQTIEVVNTDAEGRLVLADVLWYCQDRFKPRFMVDLATLTGACVVALGHHHAGLFATDDTLAEHLLAAGQATGEKLWRLPLGEEYDKLIDSKFADVKNAGGRDGGAITAAQFLKRFVNETPFAHLDIAGTAMGAPDNEICRSWGGGFGVRLLDRFVRDYCEG